MSKVFDAKRFGNYFLHDIKSAWRDSGNTLIICALAPVIIFIFALLFQLVFTGGAHEIQGVWKGLAIAGSTLIVSMVFPTTHYGPLTEKRYGSSWLMLPASRFEKFLSVLLLTCLVLPICFIAAICAVDLLMSLIPVYGSSGTSKIVEFMKEAINVFTGESGKTLAISAPYALYLSFAQYVLIFTLGAIFFKKGKIGNTILAVCLLSLVSSIAMGFIGAAMGDTLIEELASRGEVLSVFKDNIRIVNTLMYVSYIVCFAALDILIYLRIKTLKH